MSGQWPRSISLAAASDYFFVLVDFRKAKIKKRVSPSADGDLRLCLKTPQAFRERLERKL
ncbi:MAG TPA: hypothetical protein K8V27_01105 [Butyricicoccus pullicaecorum]|nr:hypothetical protein [Butyricicoccus pullicaecorum]